MARCTYCANELPPDAPICPYCGASLATPPRKTSRTGSVSLETPVAVGGPTLRGFAAPAAAPASAAPAAEGEAAPSDTSPASPQSLPLSDPDTDPSFTPPAPPSPADPTPNVLLSHSIARDLSNEAAKAMVVPEPGRAAPAAVIAPAPLPTSSPSPARADPARATSSAFGDPTRAPATPASEGGYPGVRRTNPGGLLPGMVAASAGGLSPRAMRLNAARARAAAAQQEAVAGPPPGTVTLKTSHLILIGVALILVLAGGGAALYFGTDLFNPSAKADDDRDEPERPTKPKRKKPDDDPRPRTAAGGGPLFGKEPLTSDTGSLGTAGPDGTAAPSGPPPSLLGAGSVWTGGIASAEKYYRSVLRMEISGKSSGDVGLLIETEEFTGGAEEIPAGSDHCEITYRRPMTGSATETSVTYRTVAGKPSSNTCKSGTELAADTKDEVTCRMSGDRLDCAGTYKAGLTWARP